MAEQTRISRHGLYFLIYPFEDSYVWTEVTEDGERVDRVGTSAFLPVASIQACIEDIDDCYINPGPMHRMTYEEAAKMDQED